MFGSMNRPETDCVRNLRAQIRRGSNVQNTTKRTRTLLHYQDAKVAGADDMIGKVKTSTIVANGKLVIRYHIHGVSEGVSAPPICPPILTIGEHTPELRTAISTDPDQGVLCERYREPAPVAKTIPTCLRTADLTPTHKIPRAILCGNSLRSRTVGG